MGSLECTICKRWLEGVYFQEHRKRKFKLGYFFNISKLTQTNAYNSQPASGFSRRNLGG